MTRWRYFGSREVAAAKEWAATGGIAVHENIWKSRERRTCHLLAGNEGALVGAAVLVGCSPWWIQRTRTLHFDLVEGYLALALARCATDSAIELAPLRPVAELRSATAPGLGGNEGYLPAGP